MWLRRPDVHDLAGAYAMDAVAPADRARFERHLARCVSCAQETAELREATARLAAAAAAEPPAALIEATLAAAAGMRQLPPVSGPRSPVRTERGAGPAHRPRVRWPGWRLTLPGPAIAVAVVLVAVTATLGGITLHAEQRAATAGQRAGADDLRGFQIAEVLTSPDAVMLTARVRTGGTATAVISRGERALVFTTVGLPPLPATHCYQLWLMGPSGDRSAGMLPAQHHKMTTPVIASGLAPGDRVGLTIEPHGGTHQPTTPPVLMLTLPS
jgi:anti-sigma-K factor RskA/putative zinc finger protein